MSQIDIARALKDKTYFNSLTADEQKEVRAAGGVGGDLTDENLESVSGGLEGGDSALYTSSSGCASVVVVKVVSVVSVSVVSVVSVGSNSETINCTC
jgi:hypothetical protein